MSQPEHLDAPSPCPPSGDLADSSRRAFLGLGGAITLALTGAAPAMATGSTASAATDLAPAASAASATSAATSAACPTGLDPAELAGSRSTLLRAAKVAATDSPATLAAAPAAPRRSRFARCRYRSRADWGADESLRFDAAGAEVWPPTYWPVQTITVHHTADGSTDPDPAARIRSIYYTQAITRGYGDIGYQFLIDDAGVVYEGRWSGSDGLPGFSPDGLMVNGAHVVGYNAGNVGIALLGDFTATLPSAAAYHSLVDLLAVLTRWQGIDPQADVHYVNPISGATADVAAIPGHRDWAPTLCPGDAFAPMLGQLRQDVAAR